jgi:mannose/fructose/N-acetylgalactosamine-specific phosphotransferase system component IID
MAADINKCGLFLRSLFYTANLNIENMQGTGFSWLLKFVLDRKKVLLPEEKLNEESGYFNTHPFFITFIIGVWFKELNTKEGPDYWKNAYSSAFAAIGDSFFNHTYKVFCFLVSGLIGIYNPVAGLIAYLILYNLIHFLLLFYGFKIGFFYGKNLITWFNRFKINQWGQTVDIISVFLLGFFLSALMKINFCSSYWNYFLGAFMLLFGLFFARILNVAIIFIIALICFGVILFLGGL